MKCYLLPLLICCTTVLTAQRPPADFGIRFGIVAGVEARTFRYQAQNRYQGKQLTLPTAPGAYFSAEAELLVRRTGDRLAAYTGFAYRSVRTEATFQYGRMDRQRATLRIDQPSVAQTIGARYRFRRADALLRPFLHLAGSVDVPLRAAAFYRGRDFLRPSPHAGLTLGTGLRVGRHFEVGWAYSLGRNLLQNFPREGVRERTHAITVAYRR